MIAIYNSVLFCGLNISYIKRNLSEVVEVEYIHMNIYFNAKCYNSIINWASNFVYCRFSCLCKNLT